MNGPELLRIVDSIHREKSIDKEIVFEGIEQAILSAARKHYGEEEAIEVHVDRGSGNPTVAAFENLIQQDELTPDWLSLSHRFTFALHRLRGSKRLSDIRVAIFGPAALTALARRSGNLHYALPKKSFYAVHSQPKLFFGPSDFSALIDDPQITGFHISPKGRGKQPPVPGSLYAWATKRFG